MIGLAYSETVNQWEACAEIRKHVPGATLAFDEARHKVRVNAACPGATFTPFHEKRFAKDGRTQAEIDAIAADCCLLQRWAAPREIAYPILWLASDEASYVTVTALMADGGGLTPS